MPARRALLLSPYAGHGGALEIRGAGLARRRRCRRARALFAQLGGQIRLGVRGVRADARTHRSVYSDTTAVSGSSSIQPNRRRTLRAPLTYRNRAALPIALHLGVLALYIVLCIVWVVGAEKNIHVELAGAARLQTWINLFSHVVMLLFATAIVAVMQPIATRSPFGNLPQPLTALSDKIAAWNGLGSALLNLLHNLSFRATLPHALLTATYFGTLSGLGISSSFLFDVPPANTTVSRGAPTVLGAPSARALVPPSIMAGGMPRDFSNVSFDWYRSDVGVGMLVGGDSSQFYPGLAGARVYDTLNAPASGANASAAVSYTDFAVRCGAVPGAVLSANASNAVREVISDQGKALGGFDVLVAVQLNINYTLAGQPLALRDGLSVSFHNTSYAAGRLWAPADVLLRVPSAPLVPGVGRNLILYNIYNATGDVAGSRPILDASGSAGEEWAMNVSRPNGVFETGLRVQVIGCSLSTSAGNGTLDGATNRLLDAPRAAGSSSTWGAWAPDTTKSNLLEDTWASMFLPNGSMALWEDTPSPPNGQWSCTNYFLSTAKQSWGVDALQAMHDACHVPTLVEEYLTTRLFGPATTIYNGRAALWSDTVRDPTAARATLSTLEEALANATAMSMWSAARARTLTTYTGAIDAPANSSAKRQIFSGPSNNMPFSTRVEPGNGTTTVYEQVLVGRLSLNVLSLGFGTLLASLLAGLGLWILAMGDARVGGAPVEDAGLLALMALDNGAVAARLGRAGGQSEGARRRAGMFEVRIVDGRLVPVDGQGRREDYEMAGKSAFED